MRFNKSTFLVLYGAAGVAFAQMPGGNLMADLRKNVNTGSTGTASASLGSATASGTQTAASGASVASTGTQSISGASGGMAALTAAGSGTASGQTSSVATTASASATSSVTAPSPHGRRRGDHNLNERPPPVVSHDGHHWDKKHGGLPAAPPPVAAMDGTGHRQHKHGQKGGAASPSLPPLVAVPPKPQATIASNSAANSSVTFLPPACPGYSQFSRFSVTDKEPWLNTFGNASYWKYLNRNWQWENITTPLPVNGHHFDYAGDVYECATNCDIYNSHKTASQPECVGVSWSWQSGGCFLKSQMLDIYWVPNPPGDWKSEVEYNCHDTASNNTNNPGWVSMVNAAYDMSIMPNMKGVNYPFNYTGPMVSILQRCPNFEPDPYNATVYISQQSNGQVVKATTSYMLYPNHDFPMGQGLAPSVTIPYPIGAPNWEECLRQCTYLNTNPANKASQPVCQSITFTSQKATTGTGFNCYLRGTVVPSFTWTVGNNQTMNFDCRYNSNPWNATGLMSAVLASAQVNVIYPWGALI